MSHIWTIHNTQGSDEYPAFRKHLRDFQAYHPDPTSIRSYSVRQQVFVTWRFHMCVMTRLYVSHDSFVSLTWLVYMCDMPLYVWNGLFICVSWLIHMCVMAHSYVCHGSFTCVLWLIHMCVMAHSYVCRDSFICVSWLIHMCAMAPSCVCNMTHSYV